MLKIKDNTSKQNLSIMNCQFWNNELIKKVLKEMKSIRNGIIYINDKTVEQYNLYIKGFLKSNASFVRQVRKLNKKHYFDGLVEKVEERSL